MFWKVVKITFIVILVVFAVIGFSFVSGAITTLLLNS